MSLFNNPAEHAANPPESWAVVSVGRRYELRTADGITLDSYQRRRDAEAGRTSGPVASLYADEKRWYAGESVRGWRPYSDLCQP
jgi:hypothetical protein